MAKKTSKKTMRKAGGKSPGSISGETRVAVFVGDPFLCAEYTASLKKQLEARHGEVDQIRFDGASAEVAEVLDECRSFGLMQQHKLIVVDEADSFVNAESRPMIERYCAAPVEAATLVFRGPKWNKGKLDDLIADPELGCGTVLKCDAPTEAQAMAWAVKRAEQRHGAKLDRDASQALVGLLGADLGRIDAELGKLAAAAGTSPCGDAVPIGRALVHEFVGVGREEQAWAIQADLLSGNPQATLAHLRDLIEVSRHDTVFIGFAMSDLARKLHLAACGLASGRDGFSVAKELKLWGPAKDAIMHAAGRMGPVRTQALFDEAIEADVAQKTGLGDGRRRLERLALRFAGAA
ncbi:MAG: DNA polymerase III subunit delta [Planctomycetota bacterium]